MKQKIENIEYLKEYRVIKEIESKTKCTRRFIIICPSCSKSVEAPLNSLRRANKNEKLWNCEDCRVLQQHKRSISLKKRKNNTSGYIGVNRVDSINRYVHGWQARLMIKGVTIFKVFLSDKEYKINDGALACAIERDLYINMNNLESTRNFTNKELIKLVKDTKNIIQNIIQNSIIKRLK